MASSCHSANKEINQAKEDFGRCTADLQKLFDELIKKASMDASEEPAGNNGLQGLKKLTGILQSAARSASAEVKVGCKLDTPLFGTPRARSPPVSPSLFAAGLVNAIVDSDSDDSFSEDSSFHDEGSRHYPDATGGQDQERFRSRAKRVRFRMEPHDLDIVFRVILDLLVESRIHVDLVAALCRQSNWNKWMTDELNIFVLVEEKIRHMGGSPNYLVFSAESYKKPLERIMREPGNEIMSERFHIFHNYGETGREKFLEFHRQYWARSPGSSHRARRNMREPAFGEIACVD